MIYRWIYQHLHNLEIIHLVHQTFLVCVLQFCSVAQSARARPRLSKQAQHRHSFPDGRRLTNNTRHTADGNNTYNTGMDGAQLWHLAPVWNTAKDESWNMSTIHRFPSINRLHLCLVFLNTMKKLINGKSNFLSVFTSFHSRLFTSICRRVHDLWLRKTSHTGIDISRSGRKVDCTGNRWKGKQVPRPLLSSLLYHLL